MSTNESRSNHAPARLGLLFGAAAVLTLFAALYPRNPSTAWGALCGGAVVITAAAMLQHRRDGGTLGRGARGEADERDRMIGLHSLAAVGWSSFLVCAGGMVAVVWGASPLATLGVMTWLLLAVAVGSHLWWQRRL